METDRWRYSYKKCKGISWSEEELQQMLEANFNLNVSVDMFNGNRENMCMFYKYYLIKNSIVLNCDAAAEDLEYYLTDVKDITNREEIDTTKLVLTILTIVLLIVKCKWEDKNIVNEENVEEIAEIVIPFFELNLTDENISEIIKKEFNNAVSNYQRHVYMSIDIVSERLNEAEAEMMSAEGEQSVGQIDCSKVNEFIMGIIKKIENIENTDIDSVLEVFLEGIYIILNVIDSCPNELEKKTVERYVQLYTVLDMIYYEPDISESKYGADYRRVQREVIPMLKKFTEPKYEEDSEEFSDITLTSEPKEDGKCGNESLVMGEEYDEESNDTVKLYIMSSNNTRFAENAMCVSKDEMRQYLSTDIGNIPSNIMSLWIGGEVNGVGGKPSYKMVVKVPPNNVYVTLGTFIRIMHENHKKLYLIPLYGGKKRRIGNIQGIIGVSMNHGQIPGERIYKGYTKKELEVAVKVTETKRDYPLLFSKDIKRDKEITLQSEMDIVGNEIIEYLISEW